MRVLFWGNNPSGYRQENFIDYVTCNNDTLLYSKTVNLKKNKLLRFAAQFAEELSSIPYLLKSDLVYIPPMEHTIGKIILSKLFKRKMICDIYAPLYDTTVNDEKVYRKNSLMGRLHYYRDRLSMKHADMTLFLNEAEMKHFIKTVHLSASDVKWMSVPLVVNQKKPAKLHYFNGNRSFPSICWTGSFVALQGIDCIIEAIGILKDTGFKTELHIIGPDCDKKTKLQEKVFHLGLSDSICFDSIWGDMEAWEAFMVEHCDITLGIFGYSDKAKCVVANKVIDGIAYKTPVITAESSGIDLFFDGKKDIYTVENKPQKLADMIRKVAKTDRMVIQNNINNAYSIYKRYFSKEAYFEHMNQVFHALEADN